MLDKYINKIKKGYIHCLDVLRLKVCLKKHIEEYGINETQNILNEFNKREKNNCWLCEEIKKGCYRMENSNKTLKLEMYKEQNSGDYIIQANGEDALQQEINYCPMCR